MLDKMCFKRLLLLLLILLQAGDIALLKLKTPLVLGVGVAPVCLAPDDDYQGREVVLLGWGSVSVSESLFWVRFSFPHSLFILRVGCS